MLQSEEIKKLRELFEEAVSNRPIDDLEQAGDFLSAYGSERDASDRLFDLLVTIENTGVRRGLLLELANHFYLATVIDGRGGDIVEALSNLSACIPGVAAPDGRRVESGPIRHGEPQPEFVDAYIRPLDESDAWKEALLIGRALSVLGRFPFSNARTKAVAEAAVRLKQQGYRFTINTGAFHMQQPEIERIVADIEQCLRQLGSIDALGNIMRVASSSNPYAYEQFLFGQKFAPGSGAREPTIPIGLLFNIAVKLPAKTHRSGNPAAAWGKAVALARDFVATLDLEAYTNFAFLSTEASRFEARLRELGQFDHCFALRQWHLSFTPEFLTCFFGSEFDAAMKEQFGWTVQDAAQLAAILSARAAPAPKVIPTECLVMDGMDRAAVAAMLPRFSYAEGEGNRNYRSPFNPVGADVIFRPAISVGRQHLLLPTASVIGPAIFEATFAAVKSIISATKIAALRGEGTERLARHVFGKRGLQPSFENAKYSFGPTEEGECDLVFDDDENILFVECKAKALTRDAMTGVHSGALLDFAGGLFASQAQALRHERILRSVGAITFLDGRRLEFRNRRITRLTVTLADHGTLQNRWILKTVHEALLSSSVSCAPDYARKKQVKDFNDDLGKFQAETRLLLEAGHELSAHALNAASASIAQLDVILAGVKSLTEVRERLAFPMTFSTFNVLLEHFYTAQMRDRATSETSQR